MWIVVTCTLHFTFSPLVEGAIVHFLRTGIFARVSISKVVRCEVAVTDGICDRMVKPYKDRIVSICIGFNSANYGTFDSPIFGKVKVFTIVVKALSIANIGVAGRCRLRKRQA